MSLFQALFLGLLQGLTEFLPVSSSGHLTVVPFIFGWDQPTVAFDVAVHSGTLLSVVWIFRERIRSLVRAVLSWGTAPETDRELVRFLVVGTIPAAIVGVVFRSAIESTFERPVLVSLLLGVTGWFLMSSETAAERRAHAGEIPRSDDELARRDVVGIGVAQAAAVLPGISRSGSTIGAGLRLGIGRAAAARFSFLLAVPVIAGATVVQLPDFVREGLAGSGPAFLVGIVVSAVTGAWAIRWFLGVVERHGLRPFGGYCFLIMVAGLLTGLARG